MRYQPEFPLVVPHLRAGYPRVTHPFAARLTLAGRLARLACVKHAASVHSEPGSNSPVFISSAIARRFNLAVNLIRHQTFERLCYSEAPLLGRDDFICIYKNPTPVSRRDSKESRLPSLLSYSVVKEPASPKGSIDCQTLSSVSSGMFPCVTRTHSG